MYKEEEAKANRNGAPALHSDDVSLYSQRLHLLLYKQNGATRSRAAPLMSVRNAVSAFQFTEDELTFLLQTELQRIPFHELPFQELP